jgi:hypothetical protein
MWVRTTKFQSHAAGILVPGVLDGVHMWVQSGGKEVLQKVGVWVICCGIQADGPMRQLLNRCLGHAAQRGCDCCGIMAKKGVWNANKFLGCVTAFDSILLRVLELAGLLSKMH